MVVVDQNIDDGASTIDDDTNSILVDFSDFNQARSAPTPAPDDFAIKQARQQEQLQKQRETQQQEQQFAYIQQLLREIENLRAQLDRLSVEVINKLIIVSLIVY